MQQRQFNVFSPLVVLFPGETFQWIMNKAEGPSVTVQPSPGTSWPLDKPSYVVAPNAPATAKVIGGTNATFACTPPANNVTTQKIILTARVAGPACDGASVEPGGYFIMLNESAETLMIAPDPANANYWPLPQPRYAVPPNSWIAVAVPSDAANGSYPVTVTDKLGVPQCPQQGQPIIIVQPGGIEGRKR
jgi:hypothetical protein